MIPDNILIFIISIVLIYCFDHKILPTIAMAALSLFEIWTNIQDPTAITESMAIQTFLFSISLIYASLMIFVEDNHGTDDMEKKI